MTYFDGTHLANEFLSELHYFANDLLGIPRKYFQDHPKHPHYDVMSPVKKELAYKLGATPARPREVNEIAKKCRENETWLRRAEEICKPVPFCVDWVSYKGEVQFAMINFEESVRLGKPMIDLGYCATALLINHQVDETVEYSPLTFKPCKLSDTRGFKLGKTKKHEV